MKSINLIKMSCGYLGPENITTAIKLYTLFNCSLFLLILILWSVCYNILLYRGLKFFPSRDFVGSIYEPLIFFINAMLCVFLIHFDLNSFFTTFLNIPSLIIHPRKILRAMNIFNGTKWFLLWGWMLCRL